MKFTITLIVVLIISSVQLLQRYGWTEVTGRTLLFKDIAIIYMGYTLLGLMSVLIYLLHKRLPLKKEIFVKRVLIHLPASVAFAFLHSFLFSVAYYFLEPTWQDYAFTLLYKDVLLNYLNGGLIFYWVAILFSEAFDGFFASKTQSFKDAAILALKDQGKTHILPIDEIQYVLSADNYVKVITENKKVMSRESMTNLEKRLNPERFLRVHRSALVNRSFISEINRTPTGEINLVMSDSTVLPMSRRRKEVKALLDTHYMI